MEEKISLEKYTKTVLDEQKIFLKKSLGQNFLININIIDRILEVSNISKDDLVIEIGPGIGSLTRELVKHANHVLAIEIDKRFIEVLNRELIDYSNFTLINDDALKIDIDKLIKEIKEKSNSKNLKVKVVANLPYYISTPILIKLIQSKEIEEIYIMLQKELAERFSSKTGIRESGSITYYISYYTEVKKLMNVSRNNFKPAPNVDSQVISLIKRDYPKKANNEDLLFELVRIGFMQRRKTYFNNIKNYKGNGKVEKDYINKINVVNIEKIFNKLDIPLNIRAEGIDLDQYIDIANML